MVKGILSRQLKVLKQSTRKILFFGHLNINSIRNKFVSIQELIKRTFNIFLISETKIDDLFPNEQFKIEGNKSFRKGRDASRGGILFYINEKLKCRYLEICLPNTFIEISPLELRLLSSKWLILGTYKRPSHNEPTYVSEIQKLLTYYGSPYDNILFLGDFNMSFSNKNMKDPCDMFELNHLIEDSTVFTIIKIQCFFIYLLSRQVFLTTIV